VSHAPPVELTEPESQAEEAEAGWRDERRSTAVELLWDLVFVFAITQVTTLLSANLTWAGFGRGMLVLALMWWAWSAFVWAANAVPADSWTLRACLLLATVFIMIAGLALPRAFQSSALVFAITYAAVRFLHLALYADASRKGNAAWSSIIGFASTVTLGMVLLVVGAIVGGTARTVLWVLAVAIDYAGPAGLTRKRLRGLQQVAVAHFAERYGLFVIICLGESIVAIGVGARGRALDSALISAVALGLLITIGMWWAYFDRFAAVAEERLRNDADPVLAASDGYSYLHLVIVAGIITFAVGVKVLTHGSVSASLAAGPRLALCGGVALYLIGNAGFRMRMTGSAGAHKLLVSAALLFVYFVGAAWPAWSIAAAVTLLLAALCALETLGIPE
jgi:low temperature requirement protein LtrA